MILFLSNVTLSSLFLFDSYLLYSLLFLKSSSCSFLNLSILLILISDLLSIKIARKILFIVDLKIFYTRSQSKIAERNVNNLDARRTIRHLLNFHAFLYLLYFIDVRSLELTIHFRIYHRFNREQLRAFK